MFPIINVAAAATAAAVAAVAVVTTVFVAVIAAAVAVVFVVFVVVTSVLTCVQRQLQSELWDYRGLLPGTLLPAHRRPLDSSYNSIL